MSVKVLSGYPKKGFLKFCLIMAIGIAVILVAMAIPRIFFGKLLFTSWGTFLYITISFFASLGVSFFCAAAIWTIEYGHYKRTGLVWTYVLILLVSFILLAIFTIIFWKNTFSQVNGEYERNLRRLSQFNVILILNPIMITFISTAWTIYEVFDNSCSSCKILQTIEKEGSDVVSSKLKRHTHKEKGHYVTDYSYVRKGYAGSHEAPEYVAEHKRWVEGKEVDDGLYEHKTTKDHMICINCGRRFDRTFKTETKVDE